MRQGRGYGGLAGRSSVSSLIFRVASVSRRRRRAESASGQNPVRLGPWGRGQVADQTGEIGTVACARPGEHVGNVALDGLAGEEKRVRDLGIAVASRDENGDLPFPVTEPLHALGGPTAAPGADA